jgi:PAS domain-containing protein
MILKYNLRNWITLWFVCFSFVVLLLTWFFVHYLFQKIHPEMGFKPDIYAISFLIFIGFFSIIVGNIFSKSIVAHLSDYSKYLKRIRNKTIEPKAHISTIFPEINTLYNELYLLLELIEQRNKKRDQAEKNLRLYELRYRRIAEFLPQCIFETDDDGILTYVNKKWYEVFGYTKEDIKEKKLSIDSILNPENESGLFHDSNLEEIELEGRHKNGNAFPVIL